MGFIKIEAVINESKKFVFEIESDNLYAITCLAGKNVKFLDRIREICIVDEIVLIRTEDRDFRNGCQSASFIKDNREENNIYAYDWQGNHLWNIGSIVGDIKMPFSGISCVFKSMVENEFGIILSDASSTLVICIAGGFIFIVDPINNKMLYKTSGKVR